MTRAERNQASLAKRTAAAARLGVVAELVLDCCRMRPRIDSTKSHLQNTHPMKPFVLLAAGLGLAHPMVTAGGLQYPVRSEDLTPKGSVGGGLSFTSATQQAGSFSISRGLTTDAYASLWNGPSHELVNLHPTNEKWSWVLSATQGQQVGYTYTFAGHAALWNGSAASHVNLHPAGALFSIALATTGAQQAGYYETPDYQNHAVLWSGTAASVIDLTPNGNPFSIANAIYGTHQAGYVGAQSGYHAALWSGTAESFQDLNPPGAKTSVINAMFGNHQGGSVDGHAGYWSGTSTSFVDLNPAASSYSEILGMNETAQVGYAYLGATKHAVVWFGTADRYVDLQLSLSSRYRESRALSAWTDGNTLFVAGDARDNPGAAHPILWTVTIVPEPATGLLLGVGTACFWWVTRTARRR